MDGVARGPPLDREGPALSQGHLTPSMDPSLLCLNRHIHHEKKKNLPIICNDCVGIKMDVVILYIKTFYLTEKVLVFLLILKETETLSWAPH